jgi:glycosyltransferase 2 family protein
MPRRLRSILLYAASLLLGAGLLYLAFRPVSWEAFGEAMARGNFLYLVPMAAAALLAHAIRAWRWLLLIDTLPTDDPAPRRDFRTSFYSVMIGYMVNYAVPRVGEVARAGNFAARTELSLSPVFGTVVSERVLDMISLSIIMVIVSVFTWRHVTGLQHLAAEMFGPFEPSLGGFALVLAIVLLLVGAIVWSVRRLRTSAANPDRRGRVATAVHAFLDGLRSLARTRRRGALVISTVAIWLCYLAITYIPIPMLGITGLTLADVWLLLVVGSIAVVVPTPGGVGSYHYMTVVTMTGLLGVDAAEATAYAVICHGLQLVLYTLVGFICLVLQGGGARVQTQLAEE